MLKYEKGIKTLDIEEKLTHIENICRNQAKLQKQDLENQINLKIKDSIQEEIELFKKKLDKKNNTIFEKLEKEHNSNLWELEKEFKQKEIDAKNTIMLNLYEELKSELKEFTKSEQYVDYLQKNIEKTLSKFRNKQNLTIYVISKDVEKISDMYENIKAIEDKYIGGCIIENDNQRVNNTLLENLEEKINEYKNNI